MYRGILSAPSVNAQPGRLLLAPRGTSVPDGTLVAHEPATTPFHPPLFFSRGAVSADDAGPVLRRRCGRRRFRRFGRSSLPEVSGSPSALAPQARRQPGAP
eukprot:365510-Chlamydomonas_euryale.AAC.6